MNALLKVPFAQVDLPPDKRKEMIAFTPAELGMPDTEPLAKQGWARRNKDLPIHCFPTRRLCFQQARL